MATIEKRKSKRGKISFRAKIRRKGYKTIEKTCPTRGEAEAWARAIETKIDSGEYTDQSEARSTTLSSALERYQREITTHKKGAKQERLRISMWKKSEYADRSLISIRGMDLAGWRDQRLKAGK